MINNADVMKDNFFKISQKTIVNDFIHLKTRDMLLKTNPDIIAKLNTGKFKIQLPTF